MTFKNISTLITLVGTLVASHASAEDKQRWSATWTASPQAMLTADTGITPVVPTSLSNQTLRQIVHVSVGGRAVRVELSNAFGDAPLIVGEAHIAHTDSGAAILPNSDRLLTFGGETSVSIPAGAPAISDPVELDVAPLSDLTVSIYLPDPTPVDTFHWTGGQTGYLAAGNVSAAANLTADATFPERVLVSSVLVANSTPRRIVAAFGDSITDGSSATVDSNQRWPDLLAERLAPWRIGTINAGISGNQLLLDGLGDNAVARFERDVLSQPGVESVIVLIGINDIGGLQSVEVPTPEQLIAGYRQLIAQAHSRDIRILGATITPFENALADIADGYYTPEKDQVRGSVNEWIRSSGEFDAVVDFDLALRDPAQPARIQAAYDSGDHLHPNDAGYRVMADAIELDELRSRR